MIILKIKTTHNCDIYIDGSYVITASSDCLTRINLERPGIYCVSSKFNTTIVEGLTINCSKSINLELTKDNFEYLHTLDFFSDIVKEILSLWLQKSNEFKTSLKSCQLSQIPQIFKQLFNLKDNILAYENQTTDNSELVQECLKDINDNLNKAKNRVLQINAKELIKLKCSIIQHSYNEKAHIVYHDYGFQIDIPFDKYCDFENGFAIVAGDNGYGIIDKAGNLILPCEYDDIEFLFFDQSYPGINLHGVVNKSHPMNIYVNCEGDFEASVREDLTCVYNSKLIITCKPIKSNTQAVESYDFDVSDSEGLYWDVPEYWDKITHISDENYLIYHDSDRGGYGIAKIDTKHGTFHELDIDIYGCKEIFHLGGEYYIINNSYTEHEITDVEQWFIDEKKGTPRSDLWKFSKETTIFNSRIYSVYDEAYIYDDDMWGDGIPCELFYDDDDLIIVKGKITYDEDYSIRTLELRPYDNAGRGADITDTIDKYFYDWTTYNEEE